MKKKIDSPQVITLPPFIYLSGLGAGIILQIIYPIHIASLEILPIVGLMLVVIASVLVSWSFKTMKKTQTNIDVRQPVLHLVTNGPFSFSRNPIYLAMTILYLGISLVINNLWVLVFIVPILTVMELGVIRREEKYLSAKFGWDYVDYKKRVNEWI